MTSVNLPMPVCSRMVREAAAYNIWYDMVCKPIKTYHI